MVREQVCTNCFKLEQISTLEKDPELVQRVFCKKEPARWCGSLLYELTHASIVTALQLL
jgi:hypothetical protein